MADPLPLPPGSTGWLIGNGLVAVGGIALLIAGRLLDEAGRERLLKAIGALMCARYFWIQLHFAQLGVWSVEKSLPLHMSALSALLCWVVVFWRRQLLYEVLLMWGVTGGLQALITPVLPYGDAGWLAEDYFLSHGVMLLLPLYLTWGMGMRPRRLAGLRVWGVTQVALVPIFAINALVGGNYMYLMQPPPVDNPLIQGSWPWYVLVFEVAALLQWVVLGWLVRRGTRG